MDFDLERFMHLYHESRVLLTPFHTGALMSPPDREGRVDGINERCFAGGIGDFGKESPKIFTTEVTGGNTVKHFRSAVRQERARATPGAKALCTSKLTRR